MDEHTSGTSRSAHLDRVILFSMLIAAAAPILIGATYPAFDIVPCHWYLYSLSAMWWVLLVLGSASIASGLAALVVGLRLTPRAGMVTTAGLVIAVGLSATLGLVLGRAIGGCAPGIDWVGSTLVMCTIASLIGAGVGLLIGLGIAHVRHRGRGPEPGEA